MSDKTKSCIDAGCAIAVIAIGMVGLGREVPYSGWVLFVGLLWALGC